MGFFVGCACFGALLRVEMSQILWQIDIGWTRGDLSGYPAFVLLYFLYFCKKRLKKKGGGIVFVFLQFCFCWASIACSLVPFFEVSNFFGPRVSLDRNYLSRALSGQSPRAQPRLFDRVTMRMRGLVFTADGLN